ncbi:hypothetical protein EVAR_62788_1 [Eumeta japonica]|uniref:Secreted protein n=1 Tax=Eumeta variegata TaxID=151549 RepID=A0A4C1Z0V1_EUMVA|nr:hypothetical protein EVAR_62788_1 [Eumeta japonica]
MAITVMMLLPQLFLSIVLKSLAISMERQEHPIEISVFLVRTGGLKWRVDGKSILKSFISPDHVVKHDLNLIQLVR